MTHKISSRIHWSITKTELPSRFFVTQEEYEDYIKTFDSVYELESLHRDDTDLKTYAVNNNTASLVGWADYYHKYFYIYK